MAGVPPKKQLLKVVVLGNSQCGKTTLISKYISNQFRPNYLPTIGADFLVKEIDLNNAKVGLQIWDTSGNERFRSLGFAFYRGADACVLMYDCTDAQGLNSLELFRDQFLEGVDTRQPTNFPMVLVGCKADRDSNMQVKWSEAQTWARSRGDLPVFLTSAKDGMGVNRVFEEVATLGVRKKREIETAVTLDSLQTHPTRLK